MIRCIAAIDSLRGIADDNGIPWDLPSDSKYYKEKVSTGTILMGYGTYLNHSAPLHDRTEYVAMSHVEPLRAGFEAVADVDGFLENNRNKGVVWVLGGAGLFATMIEQADELYITQVCGEFGCTKFFPRFEDKFDLIAKSKIKRENGIEFQYQVWKNKKYTLQKNINDV